MTTKSNTKNNEYGLYFEVKNTRTLYDSDGNITGKRHHELGGFMPSMKDDAKSIGKMRLKRLPLDGRAVLFRPIPADGKVINSQTEDAVKMLEQYRDKTIHVFSVTPRIGQDGRPTGQSNWEHEGWAYVPQSTEKAVLLVTFKAIPYAKEFVLQVADDKSDGSQGEAAPEPSDEEIPF